MCKYCNSKEYTIRIIVDKWIEDEKRYSHCNEFEVEFCPMCGERLGYQMENENINEKLDSIILQNKMIQGYLQTILAAQGLSVEQLEEIRKDLIKELEDEK